MQVRRYEPKDFVQVSDWAKAYQATYSEDQLPKTGFIVDGIAAYFLYSTDSSICFLENMIANSESSKEDKEEALNLLVEAILQEAKDLGLKVAYATTNNYPVMLRAHKHGAKIKPMHSLITKQLTDLSK